MKVLVIGSTGTIGHAVVRLCGKKGYEVTSVSRSTNPGIDIDDPASIDNFFAGSDAFDAIVVAAGAVAGGPIDKISDDEVTLSVKSKLVGQINVVRKGLSKLNPNGVFVITGGMLAFLEWPQTSMYKMVNAGLDAFAKAAALDLTDGKRIVVVHPPYVAETAIKLGMDASKFPSADETAKAYVEAVESNQNGEAVFVEGHGLTNK